MWGNPTTHKSGFPHKTVKTLTFMWELPPPPPLWFVCSVIQVPDTVDNMVMVTCSYFCLFQEYDFVFDVDIQEGRPTLKLPYNLTGELIWFTQPSHGDGPIPLPSPPAIDSFLSHRYLSCNIQTILGLQLNSFWRRMNLVNCSWIKWLTSLSRTQSRLLLVLKPTSPFTQTRLLALRGTFLEPRHRTKHLKSLGGELIHSLVRF